MASVKLENVYKIYPNGAKAVKDFSLNIQNEEFVVFVGPSDDEFLSTVAFA